MSQKSVVWKHFGRSGDEANCNICGTKISCKGGSTSALFRHLKLKHDISNCSSTEISDPASIKKRKFNQTDIGDFVKSEKQTLNEILAECAAYDGFTIHSIKNSRAITGYVQSRGYQMPRCQKTIMKNIKMYCSEQKEILSQRLHSSHSKFCITVDEWTDVCSKRYINVTIHNEVDAEVLGLQQIVGSCNSLTMRELIDRKLGEFGLSISRHIIGSTHDGASIMKKYGREIGAISQLCINHGIHLTVVEVFYVKKPVISELNVSDGEEMDSEKDEEIDSSDNDDELNTNDSDGEGISNSQNHDIFTDDVDDDFFYTFTPSINTVLTRVRKIIKLFRNSPVRNDLLQRNVKEQENKELKLILDCRTRWNSLIPMLERFLRLENYIKSALDDMGQLCMFKQEDVFVLRDILKCIKPIEAAVLQLSKESTNLIMCEGVIKFLFTENFGCKYGFKFSIVRKPQSTR